MGGLLYFGIRWFAPQLASASPLYTQAVALAVLIGGRAPSSISPSPSASAAPISA